MYAFLYILKQYFNKSIEALVFGSRADRIKIAVVAEAAAKGDVQIQGGFHGS
jgi:hypothetical protein